MTNDSLVSGGSVAEKPPAREYSKYERLLLPAMLLIGVLFDRLVVSEAFDIIGLHYNQRASIFWLCYLVIFYVLNRSALRKNSITLIIGGCTALLCIWPLLYKHANYGDLTLLVIPCVLMAHAQIYAQDIGSKQILRLLAAWFSGFFVRPFSAIKHAFGAIGSCLKIDKRPLAKSLGIAIGLTALLLAVIIPLLMKADMVFGHFARKLFNGANPGSAIFHGFIILITAMLFFSHFWNVRFKGPIVSKELDSNTLEKLRLQRLVSYFVLTAVLCVYVLFCAVQFKYLFAGSGLPAELKYFEYAQYVREGFAQMVTICVINLLLYGFFIHASGRERGLNILMLLLLAVTVVILISGALRLLNYIDEHGMTWLRLLSFWFIIYLAAAVALCTVRLFREKLPVVMLCALVLLVWYTALGYASPGKLISYYNENIGYASIGYYEETGYYEGDDYSEAPFGSINE